MAILLGFRDSAGTRRRCRTEASGRRVVPLAGAEGPRTLGGRRGGNGRNRTTRPRPAADQTELSLALSATCPVVIACNAVAPNQRTAVLRTRMAISWALTTVLRSRWQSRR